MTCRRFDWKICLSLHKKLLPAASRNCPRFIKSWRMRNTSRQKGMLHIHLRKILARWIFSWNPIFSCEFFCCKTKMRSVSRDNETIIFTHFQLSMKGGSNTLTRGRVKTKLPHNWRGYASEIWEGCVLIWKEERGQRGIIPVRNGTLKKFYWGWMQQSSLMAQMFYFNMKIDSSLDKSIHGIVCINRKTR